MTRPDRTCLRLARFDDTLLDFGSADCAWTEMGSSLRHVLAARHTKQCVSGRVQANDRRGFQDSSRLILFDPANLFQCWISKCSKRDQRCSFLAHLIKPTVAHAAVVESHKALANTLSSGRSRKKVEKIAIQKGEIMINFQLLRVSVLPLGLTGLALPVVADGMSLTINNNNDS